MEMDNAFFRALFVKPIRIMGRELLPFSIVHHYVLRKLNSPFLCGGQLAPPELFSAINICSMTYDQLKRTNIGTYGISVWKNRRWAKSWARKLKGNYDVAYESVNTWISDNTRQPEHRISKSSSAYNVNVPIEYHLVRVLMAGNVSGCLWDYPYLLAICHAEAVAESNGVDTLVSESDEVRYAQITKLRGLIRDGKHEDAENLMKEMGVNTVLCSKA